MGFIENFTGLWKPKAQTPGPLSDYWYTSSPYLANAAGVQVNPTTAMRITAVYACVRLLSESGGSVPCSLFKQEEDGKELATDHPLFDVLLHTPNHYQTAFEFWEQAVRCSALRGFFYAEIVIGRSGFIEALLPLHPDRVVMERLPGQKFRYRYTDLDGRERVFMPENLFRVMAYTEEDGMTPISPIRANADSVGITEAAERYAATYFGNSATPSGSLEADGKLTDEARSAIRDSWNRMFRGPDNAGKIAVLDQGLKFKQITVNNDDSQLLETRQFQVSDICRIYRVSPHLIQDLTRSTFNNIEHQSLDFATWTMRPWFRRIEAAISRDLLLKDERREYFPKFDLNDLIAADLKAQAEFIASGVQNGTMTPNEGRKRLGLNSLPDHDETFIPNNLRKSSDPPPTAALPGESKGQQSTNKGNSDK